MQTHKLLSFSLWGNDPKYIEGMRRNIDLALFWYPGWEIVVCAGEEVPDLGPNVTQRTYYNSQLGCFWRIGECFRSDDISIACVRDADSRIGEREREAVAEFEASWSTLHVMRDHPAHAGILGGMWGCRPKLLDRFQIVTDMIEWQEDIRSAGPNRPRLPYEGRFGKWSDQPFLQRKIFDKVSPLERMVHDYRNGSFKIPRIDEYDFVGQVCSATGERKYKL